MNDIAEHRVADDRQVVAVPFDAVPSIVGRSFRGDWLRVDRSRLALFEKSTYVTENAVPLDESGYPDDMIEGFHLLGLLDHLVNPVVHVNDGTWFGWNYGLDRVRFLSPVRAGEWMRATGTVAEVEPRADGFVLLLHCTVQIEGRDRPGFIADWRVFWLPAVTTRPEG